MKQLRDRIAVITGGASGIGFATAQALGAEGMKIVLADVEAAALEKAETELRGAGIETLAMITDVSDASAVEALAQKSFEHFGGVHVVFNNAGVIVTGSLWDNSLEELHWVLNVNLLGVIHGIRSFVPLMQKQGDEGHILSTASMAGLTSAPFLAIYNATKHAVVTLSEGLHKELDSLGSRLKVSVVCPGLIQTRIMDAGRNQPGDKGRDPEKSEATPGGALIEQFLKAGIDDGYPPSKVAEAIVEAIRTEKFYVIPSQPELVAGIEERMRDVVEQRNPGTAMLSQLQEEGD